jgi:hypothetical protein
VVTHIDKHKQEIPCKEGWTREGDGSCTKQSYDGCNTTTWRDSGFGISTISTLAICGPKSSFPDTSLD